MYSMYLAVGAASVGLAAASFADNYTDAEYDQGPGNGNLDIVDVEVFNDSTNLYVYISTREFADWTNYMVFLDTIDGAGANGNNNPWFRNVEMGAAGIDYFAGVWANEGGGTQLHSYDGSSWSDIGGPSMNINGNRMETVFSLASLGLSVGDTFHFDVATTGGTGGDPATDLLSSGSTSGNWGESSAFGTLNDYTVIPTPGALALLGLGGLCARRRRA